MDNPNNDHVSGYLRNVPPRKGALNLFIILIAVALILQVGFVLTVIYQPEGLTQLFNLDHENNIPNIYSTILLLAAGYVALTCIHAERKYVGAFPVKYIWALVAFVMWAMAFDEYYSFHERAGELLVLIKILAPDQDAMLGGYGWSWTLVGLPLALAIGVPAIIAFYRIFEENRYLFYLLVAAGSMFVFGAVFMENLQVFLASRYTGFVTTAALMFEELLEMLGVSLAIFVIMRYRWEQLYGDDRSQ